MEPETVHQKVREAFALLCDHGGALLNGWVVGTQTKFFEDEKKTSTLLRVLADDETILDLLLVFANIETDLVTDKNTLFRPDSLLTRVFRAFSFITCGIPLLTALQEKISSLLPQYEYHAALGPNNISKTLTLDTLAILETVSNISKHYPPVYSRAIALIHYIIERKFPGISSMASIASLYFLRFVCPILVNHSAYLRLNMVSYPHVSRYLINISKVIQSLANNEEPANETLKLVVLRIKSNHLCNAAFNTLINQFIESPNHNLELGASNFSLPVLPSSGLGHTLPRSNSIADDMSPRLPLRIPVTASSSDISIRARFSSSKVKHPRFSKSVDTNILSSSKSNLRDSYAPQFIKQSFSVVDLADIFNELLQYYFKIKSFAKKYIHSAETNAFSNTGQRLRILAREIKDSISLLQLEFNFDKHSTSTSISSIGTQRNTNKVVVSTWGKYIDIAILSDSCANFSLTKDQVESWTVDNIIEWASLNNLQAFEDWIRTNKIDGLAWLSLSKHDINQVPNTSFLQRRLFFRAISQLTGDLDKNPFVDSYWDGPEQQIIALKECLARQLSN